MLKVKTRIVDEEETAIGIVTEKKITITKTKWGALQSNRQSTQQTIVTKLIFDQFLERTQPVPQRSERGDVIHEN